MKAVSKKRTKKISVTDMDIELGVPLQEDSCPIARAVARSFKKSVGTFSVMNAIEWKSTEKTICRLPESALTFIRRFDNDKIVKPFSFVMEY